jgi:hypothetical protein
VLGEVKALDPGCNSTSSRALNVRLDGKTPIRALHDGLVDEVKSVASGYGEQGTL